MEALLRWRHPRYGIRASQLGLELTESVLLDERAGDMGPRLQLLREQGLPSPLMILAPAIRRWPI